MPRRLSTGDGAEVLSINNLLRSPEGYGWVRGAGVTIGGSTSSIDCGVGAGVVRHDGDLVSVAEQTITLPDGDPQDPRKDLIYADRNGAARVRQGQAAAPLPDGRVRDQTWAPAPPDAAGLDGVPLAVIWVPAGATSSADLSPLDKMDARVAAKSANTIPSRSSDPPDEELLQTQWWRNTTAGELRAYFHDTREVHTISTTLQRSLGAPAEQVIEDFENSLEANWETGGESYTLVTGSFEGTYAGEWDSGSTTRDYSLPGDGLDYYAEPGDQVSLAVYVTSNTQKAYCGWGSDQDDPNPGYRVWIEPDGTLKLIETDVNNGLTLLDSASASLTLPGWYILEADYDGGGEGVHPCRIWSTASGARDTILAEIATPPKDMAHRGRGAAIGIQGTGRLDRYAVTPDGA